MAIYQITIKRSRAYLRILFDMDTYDGLDFIWLATSNGISKFDGTSFINYSKNLGLPQN